MGIDLASAEAKSLRFEALHRIGVALSKEKDRDRLVEHILLEAKQMCHADGGTLYLVDRPSSELDFAMVHCDSLGLAQGGSTGNPIALPSIRLFDAAQQPNLQNVATRAYHAKNIVHIPDAYCASGFDLSGTHEFDRRNNYRSVSLLAIPLLDNKGQVIAVLQLINASDPETGKVVPFHAELQRTVLALAAQAGIALDNQALLTDQRRLLEAFIRLIAAAIDAKSEHTGGHCERVPVLMEMFVEQLCASKSEALAEFDLTEDEWRELRVAAWLHDCGKVITPVHVMDKATKLETIWDRIALVEARFDVLERDVELEYYRQLDRGVGQAKARKQADEELEALRSDLAFLRKANVGGEFLEAADKQRIRTIAKRPYVHAGVEGTLLDDDLVENLCISRGTLTEDERIVINGHMFHTIRMLEALPFPDDLARVPEYAGGHHERMDGKGYPRGLYAGDMSIPARALAIADVFEALTASDRPYKDGKTISVSLDIMSKMKENNHLDPDLFDEFVRSKTYLRYAERFLPASQIDEVDEGKLLAVRPNPVTLPPREIRDERRKGFLSAYEQLATPEPPAPLTHRSPDR